MSQSDSKERFITKLAWFVGLWLMGVVVVGTVAFLIRTILI